MLPSDLRTDVLLAAEDSLRPSYGTGPSCQAAGWLRREGIVHCVRTWRHGGLHAWWDYDRLANVWMMPRFCDASTALRALLCFASAFAGLAS